MFDGTGFTRTVQRKGFNLKGARCLVVGSGGVGCAIAASLAADQVGSIALFDTREAAATGLAGRLTANYPKLEVKIATSDPAGYDLVVNATPMGMNPEDPLPFDVSRLSPSTFVGEVVMKTEITPLLRCARETGLPVFGRHGHAVRDDPRLPGVLRLRDLHPGRAPLGCKDQILILIGITGHARGRYDAHRKSPGFPRMRSRSCTS